MRTQLKVMFSFPLLDEREFEEPKACVGGCMRRSISKCRPSG